LSSTPNYQTAFTNGAVPDANSDTVFMDAVSSLAQGVLPPVAEAPWIVASQMLVITANHLHLGNLPRIAPVPVCSA
jgi:hypothetical protein